MTERTIAAILFSDISGYSKMTEPQLQQFMSHIIPDLAKLIDNYREKFFEINTWGDAIIVASQDPYQLARFALELRDFFRNRNWVANHLPAELRSRIALHAGVVFLGEDPIRKLDKGIIGTEVNLAARLEPVIIPGDIWCTEEFKKLIRIENDQTLVFDDLGERALAKNFGSTRAYRLRRHTDDRLAFESAEKKT
jgi:class 3 adenylate cyclase